MQVNGKYTTSEPQRCVDAYSGETNAEMLHGWH